MPHSSEVIIQILLFKLAKWKHRSLWTLLTTFLTYCIEENSCVDINKHLCAKNLTASCLFPLKYKALTLTFTGRWELHRNWHVSDHHLWTSSTFWKCTLPDGNNITVIVNNTLPDWIMIYLFSDQSFFHEVNHITRSAFGYNSTCIYRNVGFVLVKLLMPQMLNSCNYSLLNCYGILRMT